MVQKIISILLYAGADPQDLRDVKPRIREANLTMTTGMSIGAAILFAFVYVLSFSESTIEKNQVLYGVGMGISVVIFLLSSTLARKNSWLVMPLVYSSYAICYISGIVVGTITYPEDLSILFMVLLVLLPTMFINRPINIILTNGFYVALFILFCSIAKDESLLSTDIINSLMYGTVGVISGSITNSMKIRGYISTQKLDKISRIDQLTQVKNRNAYELERNSIIKRCKRSVGCIYVDVNGLHEVNNEEGHESGDQMLKFVAREMKEYFDENYIYRTGGDEFIAFVIDPGGSAFKQNAQALVSTIERRGYHIAIGIWAESTNRASIDSIVKTAEGRMAEDKLSYYNSLGREIRNKN